MTYRDLWDAMVSPTKGGTGTGDRFEGARSRGLHCPYSLIQRASLISSPRLGVSVTVVALLVASHVQGQRIDDAPGLREVLLTEDGRLTLPDSDSLGVHFTIALDTRGRYWLSSSESRGRIGVFTRDGTGTMLSANAKQAPGSLIRRLIPDATGVWAIDTGEGSAFHYSNDFTETARFKIFDGVYDALLLGRDTLMLSADVRTPELAGLPLHLLGPGGSRLESWGGRDQSYMRINDNRRSLTLRGDTVLAAHVGTYRIDSWVGGEIVSSSYRAAGWFRPPDSIPRAGPYPRPGILDIRARSDGTVLVLLEVPDVAWQTGLSPDGTEKADWDRYVDTVVEIIDWKGRSVVGRSRFDQRLSAIVTDNILASRESGDGLILWRIATKPPKEE